MPNFDDFKLAIEAMSGGKNTVLFDDMEIALCNGSISENEYFGDHGRRQSEHSSRI